VRPHVAADPRRRHRPLDRRRPGRRAGLFVREIRPRREDGSSEEPALRVAVKDRETSRKMLEILGSALSNGQE